MKTFIRSNDARAKLLQIGYLGKYTVGMFSIFVLIFIIMRFPQVSAEGVKNGINICLDTLIPSLYPFMIITNLICNYSYIIKKVPLFSGISELIFGQPAESMFVIVFSMIGGLPVGIKMTSELYRRSIITENQSNRLALFCMNAGPPFIINIVGMKMLGSTQVGKIIYLSLILSSLTIGILSKFLQDKCETLHVYDNKKNFMRSTLNDAVSNASKSILSICAWVIIFSCLISITEISGLPYTVSMFFQSIGEITTGCGIVAENYPVPIVAGAIGFGGICGHLQVMSYLTSFRMKYKYFLVSRILNASLSIVYCNLLLKLFPAATETFSVGIKPLENGVSSGKTVAVLMLIMVIFSIIGDDLILKKGEIKNIEKN